MINLELSKVLPSRAYELLANFLPGLFFVFSVGFADPHLARIFSMSSEPGFTLGRYGIISTILFVGFAIGSGFILVDTIMQFLMAYFYRLKMFVYRLVCRWPLRRLTQWMLTKRAWQTRPWVGRLHVKVWTVSTVGFQEWRMYQGCWRVFAERLLQVKYGVKFRDFRDDNWQPVYWNLGSLAPEEFRGSIFIIACHATGWAGLVAARIAPVLRNKFYIGFCLFLILNGLLHAYYLVQRKVDPRLAGNLNIRAVLREFSRLDKDAASAEGKVPDE